jgi:uncharacterized membrane protein YccC
MRGHVSESLQRGLLRIAGTVAGAAAALALYPTVKANTWAMSAELLAIGWCSLYAALTHRRAYAFLFIGLTFSMIFLDQPQSVDDLNAFARTRVLEVLAGTSACVLVSMLSTLTLRQRWPGERRPASSGAGWHPDAARHAAQGALAVALLPFVHELWPVRESTRRRSPSWR